MPKKIKKVKRYQVRLNPMQEDTLQKLMLSDQEDSVSAYFGRILVEVSQRRDAEKKVVRPVGRPRKDDDESSADDDVMVLHPDQMSIGNKGRYITKSEYNILAPRYGVEPLA